MSSINPYIFREYDIRGRVADDFPEHLVNKLGKAFGTFVKRAGGQEIAISGDIRLTTPDLINIFKEDAFFYKEEKEFYLKNITFTRPKKP